MHRAAAHEHLVNRVVREFVAVVAIGVAEGDSEQSLLDELGKTVADLARLAPIAKAFGDRFAQAKLRIDGSVLAFPISRYDDRR